MPCQAITEAFGAQSGTTPSIETLITKPISEIEVRPFIFSFKLREGRETMECICEDENIFSLSSSSDMIYKTFISYSWR